MEGIEEEKSDQGGSERGAPVNGGPPEATSAQPLKPFIQPNPSSVPREGIDPLDVSAPLPSSAVVPPSPIPESHSSLFSGSETSSIASNLGSTGGDFHKRRSVRKSVLNVVDDDDDEEDDDEDAPPSNRRPSAGSDGDQGPDADDAASDATERASRHSPFSMSGSAYNAADDVSLGQALEGAGDGVAVRVEGMFVDEATIGKAQEIERQKEERERLRADVEADSEMGEANESLPDVSGGGGGSGGVKKKDQGKGMEARRRSSASRLAMPKTGGGVGGGQPFGFPQVNKWANRGEKNVRRHRDSMVGVTFEKDVVGKAHLNVRGLHSTLR